MHQFIFCQVPLHIIMDVKMMYAPRVFLCVVHVINNLITANLVSFIFSER